MDPRLLKRIDEELIPFNDKLIEGFHKHDLGDVVDNVDKKLKVILKHIECKGVYYKGLEVLLPSEIMDRVAKKSQDSKVYDIKKETLIQCRIKFEYDEYLNGNLKLFDEAIISLPYVDQYGDLFLDGGQYSLQMVLSERCLSVTKENSLLLKLLGYKCKIGASNYSISLVENFGGSITEARLPIALPSSRFYKAKKKSNNSSKKPTPLLAWYNFVKRGFVNSMENEAECEFAIGEASAIISKYGSNKEWTIFKQFPVRDVVRLSTPIGIDLAIAVKPIKRKDVSTLAKQYIAALFLAVDIDELLYDEFSNDLDNPDYWKLLIAKCSVWEPVNRERYLKYMSDHFLSMEGNLEEISLKKLRDQFIVVDDIFGLFDYIMNNRSELLFNTIRADVFNKVVASSEYALESIFESATRFKQMIMNTTDLKENKFSKYINSYFKPNIIYSLKTGGNASMKATPTDNPLADYLLEIIPQSKVFSSKVKPKSQTSKNNDNSLFAHASIAFACSYQRITKPYPDGRGYLNPCVLLSAGHNTITLRKECEDLYLATEKRLTTKE